MHIQKEKKNRLLTRVNKQWREREREGDPILIRKEGLQEKLEDTSRKTQKESHMDCSGGSNSGSCLMGFGENSNNNNHTLFCPLPVSMFNQMMNGNDNGFVPISCSDNNQEPPRHAGAGGEQSNNITSTGYYFMEGNGGEMGPTCSVKEKIIAHPHYKRLLAAYVNCHKIGAPPEVVSRLEEAFVSAAASLGPHGGTRLGVDPALDQFMEAYCEMLIKYEHELSKSFKEAINFLEKMEGQLKALTVDASYSAGSEAVDRNDSSDEELDVNNSFVDPQAEDQELKGQLLRKYSGYLGSLKQEFMKKRKKGKLPKEARLKLLEWWSRHYKWPYPSESQKLALAESTGLDQKQINNWFINQRKRHWKPSEDMQFVVMDAAHPHSYMENVSGNPFPMDISRLPFFEV